MDHEERLGALCSLEEPARAALYEYVAGHGGRVTRDEAAAAVGMPRATAAYHLDQLVQHGLLGATFARPPGRDGPGAGRPAKHYESVQSEVAAAVPPRDYRLAAELLARAVAADPSAHVRRALEEAARGLGRELAGSTAEGRGLRATLEALGYRPYADGSVLRLRNCPFHRLAQEHTEVICGMNLALMTGLVDEVDEEAQPRLDPGPDRCCVAFGATTGTAA